MSILVKENPKIVIRFNRAFPKRDRSKSIRIYYYYPDMLYLAHCFCFYGYIVGFVIEEIFKEGQTYRNSRVKTISVKDGKLYDTEENAENVYKRYYNYLFGTGEF